MNQEETPLFDAVRQFKMQPPLSLHVPGHKNGKVFPDKGLDVFQSILPIDLTELEGLDDFHHPEGPIAEAMALLSDYYQTQKSYFLINGSTAGNLAMILAMASRGEQILVQRNAHKSVFNAIQMGGLRPVFIRPEMDPMTNIPLGITLSSLEKAIHQFPLAKVLVLTYPNYYGMAYPLKEVIDYAHAKGVIVLVDEAHGAHFSLKSPVPESSLKMGADVVVHSAHKTLPAMTMGSYLHINNADVPSEKIEQWLGRLQSSSPSYPIMASLDLARSYLATVSEEVTSDSVRRIAHFRESINLIQGLCVPKSSLYQQDPFKVVIQTTGTLSGYQLQSQLAKSGIYTELADPNHVLMVFGIGQDFNANEVFQILKGISGKKQESKATLFNKIKTQEVLYLDTTLEEMDKLKQIKLPIENAAGYYAAAHIIPYPPGVPLVMQGEKLTEDGINQITHLRDSGAHFQGNHSIEQGFIHVYDRME